MEVQVRGSVYRLVGSTLPKSSGIPQDGLLHAAAACCCTPNDTHVGVGMEFCEYCRALARRCLCLAAGGTRS